MSSLTLEWLFVLRVSLDGITPSIADDTDSVAIRFLR